MSDIGSQVDRVIDALGGWPDFLSEDGIEHGRSAMSVMVRDRVIDEVVFGLVVRYAIHRAAFDELSKSISDAGYEPTAAQYLSGAEQSRAYHENKLVGLERELIGTPYSRIKNGCKAQTSFLDELGAPEPTKGDDPKGSTVTPFKPLPRSGT